MALTRPIWKKEKIKREIQRRWERAELNIVKRNNEEN